MTAPLLPNEPLRLEALRSLQVLDTPPDPVLDGLARSAATALGAPISLVSLVDENRQWFKARVGLDATETPRDQAFCAHTIVGDALFEVPDAQLDDRFAANPLVTGEPHARFYAGVPLTVEGHNVGALCVIDRLPRQLDAAQRALLTDLGRAVEHWLQNSLNQRRLREAETALRALQALVATQSAEPSRARPERDALLSPTPHAESAPLAPSASESPSNTAAAGDTAALAAEPAASIRRVLVAEDNLVNQALIRRQLEVLGFAPDMAGDGHEALARWRDGHYDLLLTDLHMPGMNGYELAEAIRREEPAGRRLPIIALTATALSDESERSRAAGMDGYLGKPLTLEQLRNSLARWLPAAPRPASNASPSQRPAIADPVRVAATTSSPQPAEAGVLLVDDDPFQLMVLQRQMMVLSGVPVHTCRSGALALEWLAGRDTSALLLLFDLNMPQMDGVEFMRHLAERHYTGALALVSGADTRVLEAAATLAGAHQLAVLGQLHKPVWPDALRTLIERWRNFIPAQVRNPQRAYSPDEVRHGIEAGQLRLHYQPKVALADGALMGVEALVRWQHPTDGLVFPDSFIAVAESHGLIDLLTRSVLSTALAQARSWRDAGRPMRVAVNISMDNLVRLDFPEFVLEALARHGVPADDLVLEVTESRLMRDLRATMDILTRLRLNSIGLSIDDFGTGHSSLAQLRDLPFDELKIDRGFVHGTREHATQRAIFTASVEMAHQLGMNVVAEGVEDRADWDFVRAAGCKVAQGYFIAKPMPFEAMPEWLAQWTARRESLAEPKAE
ncbi:MAG: response regulator [Rhizobacter sp.]|nr:response regulator [Rhizobacter sp.]